MNAPLRLRAHHLGCVLGFAGHGYDGPFTANLAAVAARVRDDPDLPILVVDGMDDVCGPCPHRAGDACARASVSGSAVRIHDQAFLRALSLVPGDRVAPAAIRSRLAADANARQALRKACSGCPWTAVCTFFQSVLSR
jgi:hypothetical protein